MAENPENKMATGTDPEHWAHIVEMCVCTNLRIAARRVTRRYDEAYAKADIRSTQAPILLTLSLKGPLTMSDLADELVMDLSTLSRNFRLLEKRGLVTRKNRDGRTVEASITDAGGATLAAALENWQQVQKRTIEEIGHDNWTAIIDSLGKLGSSDGETMKTD